MNDSVQTDRFQLSLTEEERAELLCMLEQCLTDTHMEKRRTDASAYKNELGHEEVIIRNLVAKVRELGK